MTRDLRAAPLPEYENESVFAWIRRQGNPKKKAPTERQLGKGFASSDSTPKEESK